MHKVKITNLSVFRHIHKAEADPERCPTDARSPVQRQRFSLARKRNGELCRWGRRVAPRGAFNQRSKALRLQSI